ncbi:MAG: EamA family transporter [Agrococcus casei]|uniref:EamA family transporter n=1 Tax=Agrococcus casei TaxID=343512 RepID=UPI003F93E2E6
MANRIFGGLPPWNLGVGSMLSIQLSLSLSVGIIEIVGPAGLAWLRLVISSMLFLLIARPTLRWLRSIRRGDVLPVLGLGIATAVMMVGFMGAIERIPLGTAVAIEFLGPLTVAAVRSGGGRLLVWPILALGGVVLLTEPWVGATDPLGILYAACAGAGWGAYVLLTQKVGDRFGGISGLVLTIPIAAVVVTPFGLPQAMNGLTPMVLLGIAGLAVLAPTLPFILEMLALRRMTQTAFGTLMALEPAFGVLLGLIVLHQMPSWVQAIGVCIVVVAGAGAQLKGKRMPVEGTSSALPSSDIDEPLTGPIRLQ